MNGFTLPPDMTQEEVYILEIVKQKMLQKLSDRRKFLFMYCIEYGHGQKEAADVLGVHETNVSRHMRRIREILAPHRRGYVNNQLKK
jgi:DNA-directed RNA polymerase specialized sigma24 family protein